MPPALDLTGQRFGKLVALQRAGHLGKEVLWLLRCDCGAETVAPLNRLRVADDNKRAIRACEACRARRCVICGALYLTAGSTATCGSDECRLENRRARNRESLARAEERSPGIRAKRQRDRLARIRSNPVTAKEWREARAWYARDRRRKRLVDGDQVRARSRAYYAENRERIRAYMKTWREEMTPDRRARWDERVQKSVREYRRRKALARMMQDASILISMETQHDQEKQ